MTSAPSSFSSVTSSLVSKHSICKVYFWRTAQRSSAQRQAFLAQATLPSLCVLEMNTSLPTGSVCDKGFSSPKPSSTAGPTGAPLPLKSKPHQALGYQGSIQVAITSSCAPEVPGNPGAAQPQHSWLPGTWEERITKPSAHKSRPSESPILK